MVTDDAIKIFEGGDSGKKEIPCTPGLCRCSVKRIQFLIAVLLISSLWAPVFAQSYYPLPTVSDTAAFNRGVSRTARLLTSATQSHPKAVRILVYGQSISAQVWWMEVRRFLEHRFPHAQITFINKAIGGFSSERLKLTVENDVVSFYPDLILFHDYGG